MNGKIHPPSGELQLRQRREEPSPQRKLWESIGMCSRTPTGVKDVAAVGHGYCGMSDVRGTRHSFAAAAALAMFGLVHP